MSVNGYGTKSAEEWQRQAEDRLNKSGKGDVYTPAFMTVNPDGSIAFDFSGRIHAEGLDLDLTDGIGITPPETERVQWLSTTEPGERDAFINGAESSLGLGQTLFRFSARGDIPNEQAVELNLKSGPATTQRAYIDIYEGDYLIPLLSKTIISETGESSFLQDAQGITRELKVNAGTAVITFTASAISNSVSVNHGLGKEFIAVIATARTNPTNAVAVGVAGGGDATTFTVGGRAAVALNTNVTVYWLAIG